MDYVTFFKYLTAFIAAVEAFTRAIENLIDDSFNFKEANESSKKCKKKEKDLTPRKSKGGANDSVKISTNYITISTESETQDDQKGKREDNQEEKLKDKSRKSRHYIALDIFITATLLILYLLNICLNFKNFT